MKFGLSLNVNESLPDVLAKSLKAEDIGLDYLWISDLPTQRYAPVVTAALVSKVLNIRIGVGLISPFLHTPQQIASALTTLMESGKRPFELCIGPGDRDELRRVGIDLEEISNIPEYMLNSRREISERLKKRGLECKIWLGAQSPGLLKIASSFDGVLLNYSSPDMIDWALRTVREAQHEIPTLVGIFAPSYVYRDPRPEMRQLLQFASAKVALGTSNSVLKKFSMLESLKPAKKQLLSKSLDVSTLKNIPPDIIERFSIFKSLDQLPRYVDEIDRLGVEHTVFSYPQGHSIETIEDLGDGLSRIRK